MCDGKKEKLRIFEFVAKLFFEGEQRIVNKDVVRDEWDERGVLCVMHWRTYYPKDSNFLRYDLSTGNRGLSTFTYLHKVVVEIGGHDSFLRWDPDHPGLVRLVFGVVPSREGLLEVSQFKVLVSRQLPV